MLSNETFCSVKNNVAGNITLHHIFCCNQMKGGEIDGERIIHVKDKKFIQKSGLNDCSKINLEGFMRS